MSREINNSCFGCFIVHSTVIHRRALMRFHFCIFFCTKWCARASPDFVQCINAHRKIAIFRLWIRLRVVFLYSHSIFLYTFLSHWERLTAYYLRRHFLFTATAANMSSFCLSVVGNLSETLEKLNCWPLIEIIHNLNSIFCIAEVSFAIDCEFVIHSSVQCSVPLFLSFSFSFTTIHFFLQ